MKIALRYFASMREALNKSEETVQLPEQVSTVGDVRQFLIERGGIWNETFASGKKVCAAYNHISCDMDILLEEGGEVAFFPPVTGG